MFDGIIGEVPSLIHRRISFNDENIFSTRIAFFVDSDGIGYGRAADLFIKFCQFSAERDVAITEMLIEVGESAAKLMRGFVKYHRSLFRGKLRESLVSFAF
jgi:hypothetical protein